MQTGYEYEERHLDMLMWIGDQINILVYDLEKMFRNFEGDQPTIQLTILLSLPC